MAKDDIDLDDMDFDLDEEMDFESMMGGKTYPEPKNNREAIEQSATKTFDGFKEDALDTDKLASEFITKGLPDKLRHNTDQLVGIHDTLNDELMASVSKVKKTTNTLFSSIEKLTPEGSFGESLINKARNTLGIHKESEYREESESERVSKSILNDVTSILGEKQDTETKRDLLDKQLSFYRHKKTTELQVNTVALLSRQNTFNEKFTANYYRKSLELQFHSLYTSKQQLDILKTSSELTKTSLMEIVKNTGLPDIVKQRKGEVLKGMLRDDSLSGIKNFLYDSIGIQDNVKNKIRTKLSGVSDTISGFVDGINMGVSGISGVADIPGMTKEGVLGSEIASAIRGKVLGGVGSVYERTKYGQKHINKLDSLMLDPSAFLNKKYKSSTGLKSLGYGTLADIFSNDTLNKDTTIVKDNPDSVAQFDYRTYSSINTVIPTILSNIYNAVKSIATKTTYKKGDIEKYDYTLGKFVQDKDVTTNVSNAITDTLVKGGVYTATNQLIDTLSNNGEYKIPIALQKALTKGFLKYALDGNTLHPDHLFRSGLLTKNYFRPNIAKKVKVLLKKYLYSSNKSENMYRRRNLFNVLTQMRNSVPMPQSVLHPHIKNGDTNKLQDMGLVSIDNKGITTVNLDNYKKYVLDNLSKQQNFRPQAKEEEETTKDTEFEIFKRRQKEKLEERKRKAKESINKSRVGKRVLDSITNFDSVATVEHIVDSLMEAGKLTTKKLKDITDGKYTKDDFVKDMVSSKKDIISKVVKTKNAYSNPNIKQWSTSSQNGMLNPLSRHIPTSTLNNVFSNVKSNLSKNDILQDVVLDSKDLQKIVNESRVVNKGKEVNKRYKLLDKNTPISEKVTLLEADLTDFYITNKNKLTESKLATELETRLVAIEQLKNTSVREIKDKHQVDSLKDLSKTDIYKMFNDTKIVKGINNNSKVKVVKDTLKTFNKEIAEVYGVESIRDLSISQKSEVTKAILSIASEQGKVKLNTLMTTLGNTDIVQTSKQRVSDLTKNIHSFGTEQLSKVNDLLSKDDSMLSNTIKNIKDSAVYKTIFKNIETKYKDIPTITRKDIEDVTIAVTNVITNGGTTKDVNKKLEEQLGDKVEEYTTEVQAEQVSNDIRKEIEEDKVLLNLGPLGKLVKLGGEDSRLKKLLTRNIFQLSSDLKKSITGKGFDNVPTTLEAMLMPYKYAGKATKYIGEKALGATKFVGKPVLSFLGKLLGVGFKKEGFNKLGNIYKGYGSATGKVLKGGSKILGNVMGTIGKGVGSLFGVAYKSGDLNKITDPYEATAVVTMEASKRTVAGISMVGNGIVSAIGSMFDIRRQQALNKELATDIAEEVDKRNDENRNEGKVRKGSYINRLKNLGNKATDGIKKYLPTKDKTTNKFSIFSLLLGLGTMVSKIVTGITSLPTMLVKALGTLGIASMLGKGSKLLGNAIRGAGKGIANVANKLKGKTVAKGASKLGTKSATKLGAKTLGKSLLKKIPGIGLLAGLGFGISRLFDGDFLGAAGEVGSGIASILPGAGTAASVGIDGWLAVRDHNKNKEEANPYHTPTSVISNDNSSTKPIINVPKFTGTGKERIMGYLAEAEGETVHKNKKESDITLPYGIYTKSWRNTKLEKYLNSISPSGSVRRNRNDVNNTIQSDPSIKENVKNLAYSFYQKHFMDKRINAVLNEAEQLIFFSNSVNGGKSRGVKALQSAVGAPLTGKVTNDLFTYITKARNNNVDIARGMLRYMKNYYAMLIRKNPSKYKINENGWNNRLIRLEKEIGTGTGVSIDKVKSTPQPVNNPNYNASTSRRNVHNRHSTTSNRPTTPTIDKVPNTPTTLPSIPIPNNTGIETPKPQTNNVKVDSSENLVSNNDLKELNDINTTLNKQLDIQVKIYNLLTELKQNKETTNPPPVKEESKPIQNTQLPKPVVNLERKQYGT